MSTLAEIEAAVPSLNNEELELLEERLYELRQQRAATSRQRLTSLVEFAGAVQLAEDPLEWQRRVRQEWE